MWMDCTDVATLILRNEGPGPGVEAQGTAAKIWIQDGEVSAGLEDAVWACELHCGGTSLSSTKTS